MGTGRENWPKKPGPTTSDKHLYGKFLVRPWGEIVKTEVKLTPEAQARSDRLEAYYKAEDETEDIDIAKKNKDDRKDAGDVPGLCGSCQRLRWIKTRLGHRDRYWCSDPNIQRMLPDGLLDTGDEIIRCPYHVPRPKPTDMTLRDMFQKALLIEIKAYEPGTEEDSINRGITYL